MTESMFTDARVTESVSPEVLAFLETNMPADGTSPDFQVGHWVGVTAAVLISLAEARQRLANAQQRIRELEADA